ncbi:hypothetical protein HGA64_04230 [Candidatus Falkowbacteria bacterium]|nr:hypothetical protein [Candidatus Falkowbacteria bacterium]
MYSYLWNGLDGPYDERLALGMEPEDYMDYCKKRDEALEREFYCICDFLKALFWRLSLIF